MPSPRHLLLSVAPHLHWLLAAYLSSFVSFVPAAGLRAFHRPSLQRLRAPVYALISHHPTAIAFHSTTHLCCLRSFPPRIFLLCCPTRTSTTTATTECSGRTPNFAWYRGSSLSWWGRGIERPAGLREGVSGFFAAQITHFDTHGYQ